MPEQVSAPTHARTWIQRDCHGPLELVEHPLPAPSAHQVCVELIATGLCQSQVFWMHAEQNRPRLHGHEGFGRVVAVGTDVDHVSLGDNVVLTWIPRIDPDGRPVEASTVDVDGEVMASHNVHTWTTHAVVDELYVLPVPEKAARPASALVGCAVPTGAGAVRTSGEMPAGASVAVVGLGGVGLAAAAAAASLGAGSVIGVDIDDDRLEFAKQFGVTETVNSMNQDLPAAAQAHRSQYGKPGLDLVIDCVSTPRTVVDGLAAVASGGIGSHRGGSVVVVGAPKEPITVDAGDLLMAEKSLLGCRGGGAAQESFSDFFDWMAAGTLPLEKMVTKEYPFEDLPAAVEDLAAGKILGRALVMMG